MEIGSFYHLENTGLPLSADVIDRYSESFQNGILYEQNSDSYQFKITSSFQSGIMNLGEESYEHFTFWNFTSINYNLSNNFNLFWEFNSKNSSIENDSTKDYSFRILQFGGKWNRSSYFLTMKLGIDEANNLVPLLNLGYLGKYINFKLSRELEGYTEIDDTTSRNNYIRNSISMKLNYHKFSFDSDFSYLVWNNQLIPMVSSNLSYLEDNVKFEFSGYLVQSDDVPIDKYFRTSISVSPQSEFRLFKYLEKLPIIGLLSTAPSKRFRTFAEIDGSYYHYQGNNILDFTSFHGITNQENSTAGFASQLNIAFGFQTSKFKFSYKIQNILNSQNVMFDTMQPLTMFSFLEVEWLFEN
ncbi:MAG: hypothetical protein ISS11_08545 [Candidatus Marinimicrobia bacterium]|nr:hypothetical protein [Candidatus Neomarinimicrobiota bacterium]